MTEIAGCAESRPTIFVQFLVHFVVIDTADYYCCFMLTKNMTLGIKSNLRLMFLRQFQVIVILIIRNKESLQNVYYELNMPLFNMIPNQLLNS